MTVYAKCPEHLDTAYTPYLTPGKRYAVTNDDDGGLFEIVDDQGANIHCLWSGCAHLAPEGGNWERVVEGAEA